MNGHSGHCASPSTCEHMAFHPLVPEVRMFLPVSQRTKPRLAHRVYEIYSSFPSQWGTGHGSNTSLLALQTRLHIAFIWLSFINFFRKYWTLPNLTSKNLGLLAISLTGSKIQILHKPLSSALIQQRLRARMPEGSYKGNPQHLELTQSPQSSTWPRGQPHHGRIPTSRIIWNFVLLAPCVSKAMLK